MTNPHPPPTDPGPPPEGWVYNDSCWCPWCVWQRYVHSGNTEQFENQGTDPEGVN